MEIQRRFAITCFVATVASICMGLESDSKTSGKAFGASHGGFEDSSNRAQFPSWRFGQSFPEVANAANLQSWKEWMSKRTFGSNGYTNPDFPKLATWKSWMDRKRNFSPEGSFTNIGQLDNSQFQRWSDWVSKRSLGSNNRPFDSHAFQRGLQGLKTQSWSDLAKRSYFGSNFHNIGSTNNQMQSWQDWVKRSMEANPDLPFQMHFGARSYFTSNDGSDKRQFNYSPPGFGSFRRYFTDGLQDWRNSFKASSKRAKDSQKEQKN